MKEIIYFQFGRLSNYTGTHFWNTQESYLSSKEDLDGVVDSKVSFCESVDEQGKSTLCPRVLIVDKKGEFGSLSSSNALGEISETDILDDSTWTGSITEQREQRIPKSIYHTQLESGQENEEPAADIRYWSDYSRIYFHPRSLHRLPDTSGFDQEFLRFNEEVEFLDGPLRLLAEGCDNMQGIQILNDTTTFGTFTNSFLTCFRDEYSKLPSLTFSLLTLDFQDTITLRNDKETKAHLNEALYFRNLHELSSMNIPVQEPHLWPDFVWNNLWAWPSESIYHYSALLASHVESTTLPFRLSHTLGHRDMASIIGHLKSQSNSSFGELSGAFPLDSDFDREVVNFSSCDIDKSPEARMDVNRGFSRKQTAGYQQWSRKNVSTHMCYVDSIHTLAFPLPSSFPPLARSESRPSELQGGNSLESTAIFSSLSSTSTTTARRFQRYATFVDSCIKRRPNLSMGFDIDETRELANDLWGICDNSGTIDSM